MKEHDPGLYPNLAKLEQSCAQWLVSEEAKSLGPAGVEQKLCSMNPFYWMETYGHIESSAVEGQEVQVIPFTLNVPQLKLANHVAPYLMPGDWKRTKIIVLKSRKMGISTFFAAMDYWFMRHMPGCDVFIIADKNKHTENIYKMIRLFWEKDKLPGKPTGKTVSRNKQGLFLSNRSVLEMDSGETRNPATSQDVHVLHCSENAKWPQIVDAETSLLNSVSRSGFAWMVKESTAFGINKWKTDCMAALEKRSSWNFIFLEWPDMPDCWIELTEAEGRDMKLTVEETELMETFGLTLENIKFRRDKIAEIGESKFKQDFPLHPREPFEATTNSYFDPLKVEDRKDDIEFYQVWKKIGYDDAIEQFPRIANDIRYYKAGASEYMRVLSQRCRLPKRVNISVVKGKVTYSPSDSSSPDAGLATMWLDPDPRRQYIVVVDPAEGISSDGYTSDNSVIQVIDTYGREQACELAGTYDEEVTGRYSVLLAKLYNDAMIVVEMNCKCGGAVLTYIKERYKYYNLYRRQILTRSQTIQNDEGWRTSMSNKQSVCYTLKIHFKEQDCIIHSLDLLDEMANFVEEKGKLHAAIGYRDDRIMTFAIGLYVIDSTPGLRSMKASDAEFRLAMSLPRSLQTSQLGVRRLSELSSLLPAQAESPSHRFKTVNRY